MTTTTITTTTTKKKKKKKKERKYSFSRFSNLWDKILSLLCCLLFATAREEPERLSPFLLNRCRVLYLRFRLHIGRLCLAGLLFRWDNLFLLIHRLFLKGCWCLGRIWHQIILIFFNFFFFNSNFIESMSSGRTELRKSAHIHPEGNSPGRRFLSADAAPFWPFRTKRPLLLSSLALPQSR